MTPTLLTKSSATAREAALHYAGQGCPVIPLHGAKDGLCSCGKPTCPCPGKHPRTANGIHDSTLDLSIIESWWKVPESGCIPGPEAYRGENPGVIE